MKGSDAELPMYKYIYGAPVQLINKICTGNPTTADNLSRNCVMTKLHNWREMPTVKKIRQGDSYTHIWRNHSLLKKPLSNVMTQQNYWIQGSIIAQSAPMTSSISGGLSTAWDSGLDVSTAPKYGTNVKDAEDNLAVGCKSRKKCRQATQEDLAMTEIADIAFDHQQSIVTNETPDKHEQTSGCFTVANRTMINKVLYTDEDAPEMVLIHVPPVLRPNSSSRILYFTFEMTYMVEVECYYDSMSHPQKVPIDDHTCGLSATSADYNYELNNIAAPNRHFHGQVAKGMVHNHSTHIWADEKNQKDVGIQLWKLRKQVGMPLSIILQRRITTINRSTEING